MFVVIMTHVRSWRKENISCSWNLSKCKTFSSANQIARKKHNDEELELYMRIHVCVQLIFHAVEKNVSPYHYN